MKTDTLIDLLAREAGPAPRAQAAQRLFAALLMGVPVSIGATIVLFGLVPPSMWATSVPWMKVTYTALVALSAAWLTAQMSRPAASFRKPQTVMATVALSMAALGAWALLNTAAASRAEALLSPTWWACLLRVMTLSVPALAAVIWAVRGLAPTRLRATGLAAGLTAGAVGAIAYSLSCPATSPAFVAVWYTLGMVVMGGVGAWLGPRVLRW